ncbi:MAG: AAA family ATPase [Lentisphaeraceae bacterium]|nr:AAA family ATPase [Lentisphaeraceae bacterium]
MNPNSYKPKSAGDLVGLVRKVVSIQVSKIKSNKLERLFLLLHGPAGCGKSSACQIIADSLNSTFPVTHISACAITPDIVREWINDTYYSRMDGDWRVFWIEECDALSSTVETLMLQLLDKVSDRTAILCTTNKNSNLTDRFQSRFQSIRIPKLSSDEIYHFLFSKWPSLGHKTIQDIVGNCKGDVRAALNDAQGHWDYIEFGGAIC